MLTILYFVYASFTLIALIILLYSFNNHSDKKIAYSIWLNLIAVLMLYKLAHGEIIGLFFNYINSAMYTLNLFILMISLSYAFLFNAFINNSKLRQCLAAFGSTVLILVSCILLINVWVNAYFIENRKPNYPILQVATLGNNPYCSFKYLFYKINVNGKASYLCPNYYILLPSIGQLDTIPKFIEHQFNLKSANN